MLRLLEENAGRVPWAHAVRVLCLAEQRRLADAFAVALGLGAHLATSPVPPAESESGGCTGVEAQQAAASSAVALAEMYCERDAAAWQALLVCLVACHRRHNDGEESNAIFERAYALTTGHLEAALPPSCILRLLPSEGNVAFFLPLIIRCCKRLEADKARREFERCIEAK